MRHAPNRIIKRKLLLVQNEINITTEEIGARFNILVICAYFSVNNLSRANLLA